MSRLQLLGILRLSARAKATLTLAGRKQSSHRWACGGCSAEQGRALQGYTISREKAKFLGRQSHFEIKY